MEPLILVANPGSASRKYALFRGARECANIHFELEKGSVHCTLSINQVETPLTIETTSLKDTASMILRILHEQQIMHASDKIDRIALRIVAPGEFFMQNKLVDNAFIAQLENALPHAPLHIGATLEELNSLRHQLPRAPIIGVSDSAFHRTKPSHTINYGLPLEDTERLGLKRYGYHGISVNSVVEKLKASRLLMPKTVVVHLGSGASVSAVDSGTSLDTTMGYSPLEGVVMSTRSGNVDPMVVGILRSELGLDQRGIEDYLNSRSGLLGLGGSDDVRELLAREHRGNRRAKLAIDTYVYSVQKAIGQMAAALDGVDTIIFTGTVGFRSAEIRDRVVSRTGYLGVTLDSTKNNSVSSTTEATNIARQNSKPIYVISTDEHAIMAQQAMTIILDA